MQKVRYLLLGLCLSGLVTAQTIYRSVDKDGNVVFSDTPMEGSEEIILKEVPTISLPSVPASSLSGQTLEPEVITYTNLEIASPANDEAIRENSGNVNVSIELQPKLQNTHQLTLYIDGNEYADSNATTFNLTNLERGSHQLRVAIKDAEGKILLSSPSTTFHLLRASVIRPASPKAHNQN